MRRWRRSFGPRVIVAWMRWGDAGLEEGDFYELADGVVDSLAGRGGAGAETVDSGDDKGGYGATMCVDGGGDGAGRTRRAGRLFLPNMLRGPTLSMAHGWCRRWGGCRWRELAGAVGRCGAVVCRVDGVHVGAGGDDRGGDDGCAWRGGAGDGCGGGCGGGVCAGWVCASGGGVADGVSAV